MSRLHQIQIQFDAQQDRGLLRIRTSTDDEFRFWLTRRFVKLLWGILIRMVESDTQVKSQASPDAKQAVLAFRHEQAVNETDFGTRYRSEDTRRPLGDAPLLLAKAQLKNINDGKKTLALAPMEGPAVELVLDDKLVHSLCELLVEIARNAEWDLNLQMRGADTPQVSQPAGMRLN